MSKKTLSSIPNEIIDIIFDILCINCKSTEYFIYILVSRFWAKYFVPKLWSNITRNFDESNPQSIKAWDQVLKYSLYYDKYNKDNYIKPPLFNYLKYIEELSLCAVDLYSENKNNDYLFIKDNCNIIICRNIIRNCKKLKYLDNGFIWINNKKWKENKLDMLFTKIGSMTHVVIRGNANPQIKEKISAGLQVMLIEFKNPDEEHTIKTFLKSNKMISDIYEITSFQLDNDYFIKESIKYFKNSIKEIIPQLDEVE
ncbi:7205_t:CDS:1 [Cetraspora pellucida]|uniref:7205_t:CDS:1 n=1 Tax=Cetraspora pellucida TaxID=1433469 RepID=A0A9N9PEM6_9GLOM|nr:7205_t:CDS:1 [Cetraspora pellucida]